MKLSEVKKHLQNLDKLHFQLPDGSMVPGHFHVTEVGKISKHFIDCGGTVRNEEKVNFQLWNANDYDHRLHPEKLVKIIQLSEEVLNIPDLEIEVEYQGDTIRKFGLDFNGEHFVLTTMQTDCLAKDKCGIPASGTASVPQFKLITQNDACCSGTGCC